MLPPGPIFRTHLDKLYDQLHIKYLHEVSFKKKEQAVQLITIYQICFSLTVCAHNLKHL